MTVTDIRREYGYPGGQSRPPLQRFSGMRPVGAGDSAGPYLLPVSATGQNVYSFVGQCPCALPHMGAAQDGGGTHECRPTGAGRRGRRPLRDASQGVRLCGRTESSAPTAYMPPPENPGGGTGACPKKGNSVMTRSEATWESVTQWHRIQQEVNEFYTLGTDCHDQSADWSRNDRFFR